jgi:hypothetical protein
VRLSNPGRSLEKKLTLSQLPFRRPPDAERSVLFRSIVFPSGSYGLQRVARLS